MKKIYVESAEYIQRLEKKNWGNIDKSNVITLRYLEVGTTVSYRCMTLLSSDVVRVISKIRYFIDTYDSLLPRYSTSLFRRPTLLLPS